MHVFELDGVGQRAVLDVALHRLPVGRAQVELELGGDHRVEASLGALGDLVGQHRARCELVGFAVGIEGVGEDQRVAGPVGQDAAGAHVGHEPAVEVAGVHVDERVVGQVVLHVEHEHRVGDADPGLDGAAEEPLDRYPLAPQVSLGVGCGHLDRVDPVGLTPLLELRPCLRRLGLAHGCPFCIPHWRWKKLVRYRTNGQEAGRDVRPWLRPGSPPRRSQPMRQTSPVRTRASCDPAGDPAHGDLARRAEVAAAATSWPVTSPRRSSVRCGTARHVRGGRRAVHDRQPDRGLDRGLGQR